MPDPTRRHPLAGLLELLIPVGFIAFFAFGIPFGYRVVLGHPHDSLLRGRASRVVLRDGRELAEPIGEEVRLVRGYLVFRNRDGGETWVPVEAVERIDLRED